MLARLTFPHHPGFSHPRVFLPLCPECSLFVECPAPSVLLGNSFFFKKN